MKPEAIKALIKAQSEMGAALKKSTNPHFRAKYADLGAVQDACIEPLHKNGFAVFQPSGQDDVGPYVDTIFMHEGGDIITSRVYLVVDRKNMQGVGSAITYARRYGLMGLAGIAPEDDDGNAASKASKPETQKPKDEWKQSIDDNLPQDVSGKDAADAYASAIMRDMNASLTIQGLDSVWNKRQAYIKKFESNYTDLFDEILGTFERKKNQFSQKEA